MDEKGRGVEDGCELQAARVEVKKNVWISGSGSHGFHDLYQLL